MIAKHLAKTAQTLVPWRLKSLLKQHWLRAFHFVRFGKLNVNDAPHWNDAWRRHGRDGFRATGKMDKVRSLILAETPSGVSLLDVGCGVGEMLDILSAERGCKCHGVDISGYAIEQVNSRGHRGQVTELPKIPYPDNTFDLVICTETLEHVIETRQTIAEFRRVLKDNGRLLVSVPDGDSDKDDVHIRRFTRALLERELEAHFEVERVDVVDEDASLTLFAVASVRHRGLGKHEIRSVK